MRPIAPAVGGEGDVSDGGEGPDACEGESTAACEIPRRKRGTFLDMEGLKDTVERAFDEVLRAELRRRLAERIRSGEGIDTGPELYEGTRPQR